MTEPGEAGTQPLDPIRIDPPDRSLSQRAARGALQTVGAQAVRMVLQVGGVVVLARLLSPHDYGLVAMVTAVVGVAEILRDFGLSTAAIQAPHLSRRQRDNLFWLNSAAGLTLAVLVFFCAPLIAGWYDQPELEPIARALASIFFINGLTTQFRADLIRGMRFGRIAVIDIAAPCAALTLAIVLAVLGAGPWAIVGQQITAALMLLGGAALATRWLPGRPSRREPMAGLIRFGWQLAGSQLINYAGNNIDSIIIGTRFGASSLGLYNRTFQLLMTPLGQLRQPTTTVAVPVLARLRPDPPATNRFVERGQVALGLTLVAGLGLVVGAAEPIATLFLGEQWLAAIPILRLLAAAGAFQTLAFVGYWIYVSHGLTKELLHYTLVSVTIKLVTILIASNWGLIGVAWGYALAPAIGWPLSFWWLARSSTIRVGPLFAGAGRVLATAALIAVASWSVCELTSELAVVMQLGLAIVAAAVAFLAPAVLPRWRADLRTVWMIAVGGLTRVRSES